MDKIKLLMVALCLGLGFSVQAQLNFKVGYDLGFMNPGFQNEVYQEFNKERPWLVKPFDQFKTLNGIHLGARYKFENLIGLEFNWQNRYHNNKAKGEDPLTGKNISQNPSFRYSSLGFGIENFIRWFSWGGSINYDQLSIKNKTQDMDKYRVSKENGWSSRFFISFSVEANPRLTFSIRPYMRIPWTSFDLKPFKESIIPDPNVVAKSAQQDYSAFGLTLIFYNGG